MATAADLPSIPFVTSIHMRELRLRASGGSAAVLNFLDERSVVVARSLVEVEALEDHARACLAMAAAIRARRGDRPGDNVHTLQPPLTARTIVMRDLTSGPATGAN
jgi:hypothetical protein